MPQEMPGGSGTGAVLKTWSATAAAGAGRQERQAAGRQECWNSLEQALGRAVEGSRVFGVVTGTKYGRS
jgi:hypothetical protein